MIIPVTRSYCIFCNIRN